MSLTLSDGFILLEGALLIATFLFTMYQLARDRRERKFTAIDIILKSRREMLSHNLTEDNEGRFRAEDIDLAR